MNEIAPLHGVTFFLGDLTGVTTIANKQCVYQWYVGLRFEGKEERDLKIMGKSWNKSIECYSIRIAKSKAGLAASGSCCRFKVAFAFLCFVLS